MAEKTKLCGSFPKKCGAKHCERFARCLEEDFTRTGDLHMALRTNEESYANFLFKLFDLHAERRLSDMQRSHGLRYTDACQRAKYPADASFQFVQFVADVFINWRAK